MRLIDADKLKNELSWLYDYDYVTTTKAIKAVNSAPTVYAVEVRHGKIMEYTKNGKKERVFSCCGSKCTHLTRWIKPRYCIYCGAKMDGD